MTDSEKLRVFEALLAAAPQAGLLNTKILSRLDFDAIAIDSDGKPNASDVARFFAATKAEMPEFFAAPEPTKTPEPTGDDLPRLKSGAFDWGAMTSEQFARAEATFAAENDKTVQKRIAEVDGSYAPFDTEAFELATGLKTLAQVDYERRGATFVRPRGSR